MGYLESINIFRPSKPNQQAIYDHVNQLANDLSNNYDFIRKAIIMYQQTKTLGLTLEQFKKKLAIYVQTGQSHVITPVIEARVDGVVTQRTKRVLISRV